MDLIELLKELRLMKGQEGYRYCINALVAFACFVITRLLSPASICIFLIVISSSHQLTLSLLITQIGQAVAQHLNKP